MLAKHVGDEIGHAGWCGVVFAGGMTELRHIKARTLAVNDLHVNIINLARVVSDPVLGPKLYRRLRRVPFHPEALASSQGKCVPRLLYTHPLYGEAPMELDPLDMAFHYFIAVWMGRSGLAGTDSELRGGLAIRWEAGGGDSAVRFRSAIAGLIEWRKVLARATFSTLDFRAFLDKCKDQPGHAIYCDPPFPDAGDAYANKFTPTMQATLAERLASFTTARVVCRFYDHPLIRELYPESRWTWRHLVGRKQTNDSAPEVLLINGPSYAAT